MINREEVELHEDELLQAMKNCDLEVLDKLIHEDLLFNGPTGEVVTKAIDLAAYQSGNMLVEENSVSDRKISLFDDVAVVSVIIDLKGQFMKQPIGGKFRFLRVWKKFDNQLQVIGGSSIPV